MSNGNIYDRAKGGCYTDHADILPLPVIMTQKNNKHTIGNIIQLKV